MPDSKSAATRVVLRPRNSAQRVPMESIAVRARRVPAAPASAYVGAAGRRASFLPEHLEGRQLMSVALDGAGFTVVTPSADTRVVYVSSTKGNDGNDGLSANTPVASIGRGKSLLRNGQGDHLLIEKGSKFTSGLGYWKISGKSADEPLLIGTYGTGPRPEIADGTNYAFGAGSGGAGNKLHDVVVQGIRFYAAQRDPANTAAFDPSVKADGVYIAGNVENLLFEDVSVEYYKNNFVVSPYFGPVNNFQLRNSNVSHSWATGSHSQGMYLEGINGVLLEGNTFDHNGWNEQVGAKATVFNHSAYVQGTNRNAVARNNTFANAASHGLQMRAGGVVQNNLFLDNPIGLSFGLVNGGGPLVPGGVVGAVKDNVFIGGRDISGQRRGIGLELTNTRPGAGVVVEKNIFTKASEDGAFAAINLSWGNSQANGQEAAGINDLTIKDNIVYEWTRGVWVNPELTGQGPGHKSVNNLAYLNNDYQNIKSSNIIYHGIGPQGTNVRMDDSRYFSNSSNGAPFYMAGRTYSLTGWTAAVEPTGKGVKANYVDPDRDMKTYSFTLGGSGTQADFLDKARANSRDAFSAGYTAPATNNYIRAGFLDRGDETPAIPGGYLPTPVALPPEIPMPPGGGVRPP
ncbi:MAG: hypothetical protein AVDCRST_MAG64-2042, partial [uncultured Phycisphaerae bacterium]